MTSSAALTIASAELNRISTYFLGEAVPDIHLGSALLEHSERVDDWEGHPVGVAGDVEVLHGPLSLSGPQLIIGHLDGPKGISFFSEA